MSKKRQRVVYDKSSSSSEENVPNGGGTGAGNPVNGEGNVAENGPNGGGTGIGKPVNGGRGRRTATFNNFSIRPIPGDGNCLFAALSHQMTGTIHHHEEYRQAVANHMQQNQTDYDHFLAVPFDEYVDRLSALGEWAGNDTIVAFTRIYDVEIVIHQPIGPVLTFSPPSNAPQRRLNIMFSNNNHYDSLVEQEVLEAPEGGRTGSGTPKNGGGGESTNAPEGGRTGSGIPENGGGGAKKGDVRDIHGYSQKYDGRNWKRMCLEVGCSKDARKEGRCHACNSARNKPAPPTKGDIKITPQGRRFTFSGANWLLMCLFEECDKYAYKKGLCMRCSKGSGPAPSPEIIVRNGRRGRLSGSEWKPVCEIDWCEFFALKNGLCVSHSKDDGPSNRGPKPKSKAVGETGSSTPENGGGGGSTAESPPITLRETGYDKGDVREKDGYRQKWNGKKFTRLCSKETPEGLCHKNAITKGFCLLHAKDRSPPPKEGEIRKRKTGRKIYKSGKHQALCSEDDCPKFVQIQGFCKSHAFERGIKSELRDLKMAQIYVTTWKMPDQTPAAVTVSYTTLDDAKDAAKSRISKSMRCTDRFLMKADWIAETDGAFTLTIVPYKYSLAAKLYSRLLLGAVCTFRKGRKILPDNRKDDIVVGIIENLSRLPDATIYKMSKLQFWTNEERFQQYIRDNPYELSENQMNEIEQAVQDCIVAMEDDGQFSSDSDDYPDVFDESVEVDETRESSNSSDSN